MAPFLRWGSGLFAEKDLVFVSPQTQQSPNRMDLSFFVTVILIMPPNSGLRLPAIYESKYFLLRSYFCRLAEAQPLWLGSTRLQLD